jgi:cell division protein FtsL
MSMIRGKGLVILLVLVLAFFYVWQRTRVIQLGYDLQMLKSERNKAVQVHNHLLIEASTLAALDRVERVAMSSLGMKRPDTGQIVLVASRDHSKSWGASVAPVSVRASGGTFNGLQVAQAALSSGSKSGEEKIPFLIRKIKDAL